jgi:DNA-binding CsgD family transcriptional regulator
MFDRMQRRLDRAETLLDALAVSESPDDFAMVLVNRVFQKEDLLFAFVFNVEGTSELRRIGAFGDPVISQFPKRVSIWENIVVAKSYRDNAIVRVEDNFAYRQTYNSKMVAGPVQGVIALPLNSHGKTRGAISLIFRHALSLNDVDNDEIRLVQQCGEHLLRDWRARTVTELSSTSEHPTGLTQRQAIILEKMRTGSSLGEIGIALSVSKATVKGDVQKIYRALGVHKKRDAISVGSRIGVLSDAPGTER